MPTMAGDLPPNSSVTGTRFSAAARMMCFATEPAPVNRRWSKGRSESRTDLGIAREHRDLAIVESRGDHPLYGERRNAA